MSLYFRGTKKCLTFLLQTLKNPTNMKNALKSLWKTDLKGIAWVDPPNPVSSGFREGW